MERVKCECYAIRLFRTMTEAYDYWDKSPERAQKNLAHNARTILSHLDTQFKESGLPEKQEPYFKHFIGMRTALKRFDAGEESGMDTMEIVRDTIHKSDELKQLMTCGEPYVDKNSLSETARVLAEVLDTMGGMSNDPMEDARSFLDKQYEKLSCGKK